MIDPRSRRSLDEAADNLLSKEELRDLLSPLPRQQKTDVAPVLLVTDQPEDATAIASYLSGLGYSLVPANHRFSALDLFRRRRYSAVVASQLSLGVEASGFFDRLRSVAPDVPLALICESDPPEDLADVHQIQRPLSHDELTRFFGNLDRAEPRVRPDTAGPAREGQDSGPETRVTGPSFGPSFEPSFGESGRSTQSSGSGALDSRDPHSEAEARPRLVVGSPAAQHARDDESWERGGERGRRDRLNEASPPSGVPLAGDSSSDLERRPSESESEFASTPEEPKAPIRGSAPGPHPEEPHPEKQSTEIPNLWVAARALARVRLDGRTDEEGLLAWVREDDQARAVATLESSRDGGWELRVQEASLEDRKHMVGALVRWEGPLAAGPSVRSGGPFVVFGRPGSRVVTVVYVPSIENLSEERRAAFDATCGELARLIDIVPTSSRTPGPTVAEAVNRLRSTGPVALFLARAAEPQGQHTAWGQAVARVQGVAFERDPWLAVVPANSDFEPSIRSSIDSETRAVLLRSEGSLDASALLELAERSLENATGGLVWETRVD